MAKPIILTIMCMVYKDDGSFLVMNRLKKDWPGLTFPGGHVEDNEDCEAACIREMKEETNLDISDIVCKGHIEWNDFGDGIRHFAVLYTTNKFKGELKASKEGNIFFIKEEDVEKYPLSNDFWMIYELMRK